MLPGGDHNERIPQPVTDISSDSQLIRYAVAGQLELVSGRRRRIQGKIAKAAGFGSAAKSAGPNLCAALRGKRDFQPHQLQGLDEIITALAPESNDTGGLSPLALQLSADPRHKIHDSRLTAHVPPSWARTILQNPQADEVGVLIQASSLLSAFWAADKADVADSIGSIRRHYSSELDLLVRRLILISVAPPTSRNSDAQILLGSLASYAFELMKDRLERELRGSPLGFRVWRAITKLVTIHAESDHTDSLKAWVRDLIRDSEELRDRSLYGGRSLDLELAITIPVKWSPPDRDWVAEALLKRARNGRATIRERGTAAMGLWQRAININHANLPETERQLRDLIEEFKDPGTRPDAAAGLRWVAATLEHVIKHKIAVCNDWPSVDEPWFHNVQDVAEELGGSDSEVPDHLRTGTKNLFRHMILQNAGVYRRHAIETVVASGWADPVARALGRLLDQEETEAWLRVRPQFALGFLRRTDSRAEAALTRSCLQAYRTLRLADIAEDVEPPRSHITQLHASLFAVGDCFGAMGSEYRAKSVRTTLRPMLTELANMEGRRAEIMHRPARAAAYLLMITAQPREGEKPDLSEVLLGKFKEHPDETTRRLSDWALRFRFAPDGKIRPLLAAAEYDDSSYWPG
jgi:hypothetical protein